MNYQDFDTWRYLRDEESQYIFEKRCMYSATGDGTFIRDIVDTIPLKRICDEIIRKAGEVRSILVTWGCGQNYRLLKELYPDYSCQCFCDCDETKQKNGFEGKRVFSPDDLFKGKEERFVLITCMAYGEVVSALSGYGIDESHILNFGKLLAKGYERQYFCESFLRPKADEVFIDGGCFDCNTSRQFVKWCSGSYKKIFAFEPDKENYQHCLKNRGLYGIERMTIINSGLWDEKRTIHFDNRAGSGSRIEDNAANSINVVSLDETVTDEDVTFLKLDVEGAELNALKGAKRIIQRCKPRIAVCVYHKPEDIIAIPEYILSIMPEYRFYLRHYMICEWETVLYAVTD